MYATLSYYAEYFMAILSDGQAALVQEALVLLTFAVSFSVWRRYTRRTARRSFKELKEPSEAPAAPKAGRQRLPRIFSQQEKDHVTATEKQMLSLLASSEFTRALNQYRGLERIGLEVQLSEDVFASFVQSAVRMSKVDVAERMLRTMKRSGLVPSAEFWQHTMKLMSSRRQFSLCLSAYNIFEHLMPADKVTFSCLINAALDLNMPQRTPGMLSKFQQAGIAPKDHVLHFRCYVALGNVNDAEKLFHELDTQANTLMLNLLLLTCVNGHQPERALQILQSAHALEQGMQETLVDTVSYNTVMKGFAEARCRAGCFECMKSLLEHNLQPDEITLNSLLDACVAENDLLVANEVGELLLKSGKGLNRVMCTMFIKGFVRVGGLQKALAIYEAMKQRASLFPDIVAYSVLIKGLVDQHELDKALAIFQDMKANGQTPDDIILTHLLEGCRYDRNRELGRKIFQEMLDAGVHPSDVTLVTLLKLFGRCGAHQEALELVESWEKRFGNRPSVIHYTCLMSGCFYSRKYDNAWEAFELMLRNGVAPDETTISTMLPGMVASQQWDRVMTLARMALRKPTSCPVEALNHALAQMRSCAPTVLVKELQASMKAAGIPISVRALSSASK
mmetsp:Transcript_50676/g.94638  ORF Transcript_50676/g.94638 Transcript_50676/m.94638 type:complete len:621 (-) Transcript_50676:17-1879(-)